MNNPTISVIMPVYNGEQFLNTAITSILNQSFTDFEFIIINDGSTDNTEEIILSFNDSRIIYIKNDYNLKLIKTLNKGIQFASGRYIARMDSDDISLPNRFEKQIEIFNTYNDVDIVNINAYLLDETGAYFREQISSFILSFEAIKYLIVFQNFICHPGVMVKSKLINNYKYIDNLHTEHIEDFDLWNRMLKDECICYTIDECLILYRNNINSINHTQQDLQFQRMYILCSNLLVERFNFMIDKCCLKILLGEIDSVNYFYLKKINKEISAFNTLIKNKYSISSNCHSEMNIWRMHKIISISLKSFSRVNLFQKVEILFFLICHLNWFTNEKVFIFIKKAILTNTRML